jgi:hypothetical protein
MAALINGSFIELRQYEVREGQMDAWIKFFEEEIAPYQTSKGCTIHGSYRGEEPNSNVFVWLRSFESEEQRAAQYAAMYNCPEWQNYFQPLVDKYVDLGENHSKIRCTRIVPNSLTPALPLMK